MEKLRIEISETRRSEVNHSRLIQEDTQSKSWTLGKDPRRKGGRSEPLIERLHPRSQDQRSRLIAGTESARL
jgi:hypothetical protein